MLKKLLIVAALVTATTSAYAQGTATATSLEGVWKVAEIVTTGANAATNSSPQPSLVIFARGHYSYLSVNGTTPRPSAAPARDSAKLTDAEKIARYEEWNNFTANAGTYEVNGTTLTRRPSVAKSISVMTSTQPTVQEFKLEGNTLWLISKSASGQPASETRLKLTRVQ